MTTVGNITTINLEAFSEKMHDIEWEILNFMLLSPENGRCYCSPEFAFAGNSWVLRLYPNGNQGNTGYLSLYLKKISSGPPIKLEYSLGLKTSCGRKYLEHHRSDTFKEESHSSGAWKVVLRSDLLARKSVLLTSDVLTVFCSFKVHKDEKCADKSIANAVCPHCKIILDAVNSPSHEKNCLVKCPKCSSDVILQKWYEHDCQGTSAKGDRSLCQDYKKVLMEGSHHDLILRVVDREFRAHRDILKARSTVFWSMLDVDMKEKNSDYVDIPDCSPDAMEQFLFYIYSGKVETLDQSNMIGLYYIADKYDVSGLKDECRDFIKKSLSLTNICNIIQLAMNHCDSILLEKATEYFGGNMMGIMRTVEWQAFLKDNSTIANELLLKSIEKLSNVK